MKLRHYKYQLEVKDGPIEIVMHTADPRTFRFNGAGSVDIWLWAQVDTDAPLVTETFFIFGTGHDIDYSIPMEFLDTVQCRNFVWHVYRVNRFT